MGATVLTGKAAAAFRRPDTGEILYVLFERTYEKNCYPHEDRWSCIAFGTYEQVLPRIFMHASVCEGGMLQSRSSWIAPENYIRDWQKHLKKPVRMDNIKVYLGVKLGGFLVAIPDEKVLQEVCSVLSRHNKEGAAETLMTGGSLTFELYQDVDVLLALYGEEGPIPARRAFEYGDIRSLPTPELGFMIASGDVDIPRFNVWRQSQKTEPLVISRNDDPPRNAGWQYSAVGRFIIDEALPRELVCTGSAKELIRSFRETCKAAPVIPDAAKVTVDTSNTQLDSYYIDYAVRMAQKLGLPTGTQSFTCRFDEITAADALWDLAQLHNDLITWDIPKVVQRTISQPTLQAGLF